MVQIKKLNKNIMENKNTHNGKLVLDRLDFRNKFVSSFKDKYGCPIKEGDIIKEVLSNNKVENYHYEIRYDMMGNENRVKIIDSNKKEFGWCLRLIKWSADCLIAERIEDSGNIYTSRFDYLNESFMGVNSTQDVEVIGSIYEG